MAGRGRGTLGCAAGTEQPAVHGSSVPGTQPGSELGAPLGAGKASPGHTGWEMSEKPTQSHSTRKPIER